MVIVPMTKIRFANFWFILCCVSVLLFVLQSVNLLGKALTFTGDLT